MFAPDGKTFYARTDDEVDLCAQKAGRSSINQGLQRPASMILPSHRWEYPGCGLREDPLSCGRWSTTNSPF
jgi:hypothetical protein